MTADRHHKDAALDRIRAAYDLTVVQYERGINPLAEVPAEFKESAEFKAFLAASDSCNSGASENKEFLDPQAGMRFLDIGCAAGLANHDLGGWPSTYYGVDISSALIEAMRGFVVEHGVAVGGLHVADAANLPFDDGFFDIAAMIGVLEYCSLEYVRRALAELHRVVKVGAKVVLDIPNVEHPHAETMFRLEEYLERPEVPHPRADFEETLHPLFAVDRVDDSKVMIKYFCRAGLVK